jgi:hypothetical protein
MSNNKQSMKLYPEEQVIKLTKAAFTAGQNHNSFIFWEELKNITPIEIPSDEDIEDESLEENNDDLSPAEEFQAGAKWMRDKIQGGNNEQQ